MGKSETKLSRDEKQKFYSNTDCSCYTTKPGNQGNKSSFVNWSRSAVYVSRRRWHSQDSSDVSH